MSWHYAIIATPTKHPDEPWYYKIHEVFDTEKTGDPSKYSWTKDGIEASGETPEEVIKVLEMMLKDAQHFPVYYIVDDKLTIKKPYVEDDGILGDENN